MLIVRKFETFWKTLFSSLVLCFLYLLFQELIIIYCYTLFVFLEILKILICSVKEIILCLETIHILYNVYIL